MAGKKNKEPSGYMGDMSTFQNECLQQLKEWITKSDYNFNPWFDDMFLLRFCRARKFQIN